MKQLILLLSCVAVLSGCAARKRNVPVVQAAPVKVAQPQLLDENGAPIEKIEFRAGVSSATVERLARARGCTGGTGAGLVTPPGPVEVYRMECQDGRVFKARCELRQCAPMPFTPAPQQRQAQAH